jgi:hypothetical protein
MTHMHCSLTHDRDETLIAYLYDDIEPAVRATFDQHLITCDRCRTDLDALAGVRSQLARWTPPEPNFARAQAAALPVASRRPWWREMPAWAQTAAALLFLGVAAGIANVEVRYDTNGLTVRTGWSRVPQPAARIVPAAQRADEAAPWRADLTALERQLRTEMHAAQPVAATPRPAANETEILRRVRSLLDESERRQQNELALRVAEVAAELNAKRQAEMFRIGRSLRETENKLGVVGAEVVRTRSSLNYIMNVNQQRQ